MSAPALRLVPPAASDDPALRPTSFDDYVGQSEVIGNLRESVRAARRGGWTLDHFLFAGGPGLGKTSLAAVVAAELGAKLRATSAPAIEHRGALASLLTTLADGDVLFIDEIHALDRALTETIYSALEDRVIDLPAGKRVIRVPLPKFTLLGATTRVGKLPKPLLDRFGFVWNLRPYTDVELQTIVLRSARRVGVAIDDEGALAIARASRGTPRIANRLLRRVRDAAANAADASLLRHADPVATINGPLAVAALGRLGVDHLGLDATDRAYLKAICDTFGGGPVGIEAIAASIGEELATLEDVVEPFLLARGYVARTARGRVSTAAGTTHCRRTLRAVA